MMILLKPSLRCQAHYANHTYSPTRNRLRKEPSSPSRLQGPYRLKVNHCEHPDKSQICPSANSLVNVISK